MAFGKQVAHNCSDVARIEDEKKQANDHFKAIISGLENSTSELAEKINMGYEIIPTPCDVIMNQPTPGMKQYIDTKTLSTVKTIPMTDDDKQSGLFDSDTR